MPENGFNTFLAGLQAHNQAAQFQQSQEQQQQQFEQQHQLEEQNMQLTHEHENAVLQALQSYQRANLQQQYAQNPAMIRAAGTQTGVNYSQPMTNGPTNELAAQKPTSENYSVDTGYGAPLQFNNLPTRQAEAQMEGEEAGLKNKPLFEQQSALEKQRADAETTAAQMRALLDHEHDIQREQMANESAANIARMNIAQRNYEAELNASTRLQERRMEIQGLYDPNRVSQMAQDLYNGNTTMEDFNKSPLSKYEKEAVQSIVGAGNAHVLNNEQSKFLNNVSNLNDIIPLMKDFIGNQPDSSTTTGAHIRGKSQVSDIPFINDPDQKRRFSELQSHFGELAKALSVSTGRIPVFEANKIMGYMPDPSQPREANLKKLNDFQAAMSQHIVTALNNIPAAQRANIIHQKLGNSPFNYYLDVPHMMAGQSTSQNPSTTQQTPATQHKIGDKVKYQGKDYTIKSIGKDGKLELE